MNRWYVKELSKMTRVSVRTLHHYDQLDLLKPSVRLKNGYRLYSEADLLKLQQIIALKFFGFELSQIKTLLISNHDVMDHFLMQSQLLEEKAEMFLEASQLLKKIISESSDNSSVPWKKTIQLIEVYRMKQQLEKTWAGKVLNTDELKEYAHFQANLEIQPAENKEKFEQNWKNLCQEISKNLEQDPSSELGIKIAKRCMEMVNELYGKQKTLQQAIWEKGFKGGHVEQGEHGLSPEMVVWLDIAMSTYYKQRIYTMLAQIGTPSEEKVSTLWQEILEEMCGDSQEMKDSLYQKAFADNQISDTAKQWLKSIQ